MREQGDFLKYALGVGLLIAFDRPVTQAYQRHVEQPLAGFRLPDAPGRLKYVGEGGTDGWLALGVAGTYLGGLAFGDPYSQKVGLAAGKSMLYSVAVSQLLLKTLSGRKRPTQPIGVAQPDGTFTDNPFDWGNRRSTYYKSNPYASSFPSFHFTMWFSVARVYEQAYGNAWVPYGLLTLGLASNIKGHRHWVSDMVAGGMIGTLIGTSVSKDYLGQDQRKLGWKLDAAWLGESPQIQARYTF